MKSKIKVAYLAPEIPGASSTFVYNEIFALEKDLVHLVETFSVHKKIPSDLKQSKLQTLADRTTYLYEQQWLKCAQDNLLCFLSAPLTYLKVCFMSILDALSCIRSPKLSAGIFYRFLIGASLSWQLKCKKVDHLHIHFADVPTDIGMYAALLARIPYSVTAHANDIFDRSWLLKRKVDRSKFFGTISNFNVRLLTKIGADSQKLVVVRCGVDSSQFSPRPLLPKSSQVLFGFLGRLVEKKGATVLIDACSQLKQSGASFLVQLVGDGPLLEELKGKVNNLNLQEQVIFCGAKPHSEIAPWLESLDYFVLPCVKDSRGDMDGIPVALMEAMLKGVPVISTNISGIPELVIDKQTGLTAEASSVDSLVQVMSSSIGESDEKVLQRSQAAEQLVKSEYDLFVNTNKLKSLILAP